MASAALLSAIAIAFVRVETGGRNQRDLPTTMEEVAPRQATAQRVGGLAYRTLGSADEPSEGDSSEQLGVLEGADGCAVASASP